MPVMVLLLWPLLFFACTKSVPTNVLQLSSPAKIRGLDPAKVDDLYSIQQVTYGYEGLYQYDYLARPFKLVPLLAAQLPAVSSDGLVYTISLKEGVFFHDHPLWKNGKGRELNAQDFVYSWKRLADPKTQSPLWWVLSGRIQGLDEWRERARTSGAADYNAEIQGLRALSQRILEIRLTKPYPAFLSMLAIPATFVVPQEAVDYFGVDLMNNAIGTGPYRLVRFNGNQKVEWEANRNYSTERDSKEALPRNNGISTRVLEEPMTAWLHFKKGELDISSVPKDEFANVFQGEGLQLDLAKRGIRLFRQEPQDLSHLSFNLRDPVLGKNKKLRQALSLAFDRKKFVEIFLNGQGLVAEGPIPPGMLGYSPSFRAPFGGPDLPRARSLLAEAGFPEGKGLPPLKLIAPGMSTSRQVADFVQQQFASIGVRVEVETFSWPEFQRRVKEGIGQMWSFSWMSFYPDGEFFLQIFLSKNAPQGPNDSHYLNPEYDRLFVRAEAESSEATRALQYGKLRDLVAKDVPKIFIAHRRQIVLAQPWLENYRPHPYNFSILKYVGLNQDHRK
jgi:oligopeptide transport system substrate-binding protein